MGRAYDLLSFDLDGTLVDTAAEIAEAANRTLDSHGIPRRPVAEITLLIGAGTHELMRRLLQRCAALDPSLAARLDTAAVMATLDRHYAETAGLSAQPYPACRESLDRLREAGVRLACTTNKEHRHAVRVLEQTGLADAFELLIGGDSLPEKKPHPSVLQHVAAHFGVPLARTAHLGDSAVDVNAARLAGVQAWAVPYGYNAGQPIETSHPDRLFHSLREVADHALQPLPDGPAPRMA